MTNARLFTAKHLFLSALFIGLVGGCATPPDPAKTTAAKAPEPAVAAKPAPPAPPPILAYDEAVLSAANRLLQDAQMAPNAEKPATRYPVVIDPLVDGMTGNQSKATQAMGERIVSLINEKYPQFEVLPFTAANIAKSPLVLVGTFTGVDGERKTTGLRKSFRICLALADFKSGKLVSKGLAFADAGNVDITPTPFFRDSPTWTEDPSTLGYIRTCQGTKAGDPINALYVDRIQAASLISEATTAYDAGKYADALAFYESALRVPFGNQFRVFSGLYLTNWKLRRRDAATNAFGQLVDYDLEHNRLGVKFLFQPGATAFASSAATTDPYPIWLSQIAARAAQRNSCLQIDGHTSPSGPEPVNERLSLLRAQYVKTQLGRFSPALGKRTVANGVGSRETLIGNGHDDASDALDRRVEFKMISC